MSALAWPTLRVKPCFVFPFIFGFCFCFLYELMDFICSVVVAVMKTDTANFREHLQKRRATTIGAKATLEKNLSEVRKTSGLTSTQPKAAEVTKGRC